MPWQIGDVEKHIKGLSDKQKEAWVKIANKSRQDCINAGGNEKFCDAKAIRIANAMAKRVKEE